MQGAPEGPGPFGAFRLRQRRFGLNFIISNKGESSEKYGIETDYTSSGSGF